MEQKEQKVCWTEREEKGQEAGFSKRPELGEMGEKLCKVLLNSNNKPHKFVSVQNAFLVGFFPGRLITGGTYK